MAEDRASRGAGETLLTHLRWEVVRESRRDLADRDDLKEVARLPGAVKDGEEVKGVSVPRGLPAVWSISVEQVPLPQACGE